MLDREGRRPYTLAQRGMRIYDERVAQLVEHLTFNQVVMGSSPIALTTPEPAI